MLIAVGVVLGLGAVAAGGLLWNFKRSVGWTGEAESLDGLLAAWAALPEVPGVIALIRRGDETLYEGAAGALATGGGGAATLTTPFDAASVGKLFTAALIWRLHEQGRINVDAPAQDYLSESVLRGLVVTAGEDYWDRLTLRQLLSHRAGLGNDGTLFHLGLVLAHPDKSWSPDDILAFRRRHAPAAGRPGEQTQYSCTAYTLLGLIIEAVTGRPFHEAVRAEILAPLGMESTYEIAREAPRGGPAMHHYKGWIDMSAHYADIDFACGGFATTAGDLARFGLALARNELFARPETRELMFAAPDGAPKAKDGYQAHGPWMAETPGGARLALHNGYWGVLLAVYPESETVAVFTLGQANARYWSFWEQVQALARRQGYLPA